LVNYYEELNHQYSWTDNLLTLFIKSDTTKIREFVDYLSDNNFINEYDVFIVDYDSNFLYEGESMYDKGDKIYTALSNISDLPGKLVWVGSQPKQNFWDKELIGIEGLAESSRKQQIADFILTISKSSTGTGLNHIGRLNLCKNRRGVVGYQYYFIDKSGEFFIIPKDEYTTLLKETTSYHTFSGSNLGDSQHRYIKTLTEDEISYNLY